ncbi:PrgI family protein [Paenibacillus sp. FSL R7-0179]|uniref:PrgI family protein n=1 Tax=Paenibacillus sp. FSL R7-0179 TaxID=2921672 RepID=UPI0030FB9F4E
MEVKINREIREYTESLFFGLSLRQFFFSILAVGVAIALYFGLRTQFGIETLSWMCVLGAAPCAALGFIRYHGMTAEQLLWAYVKSEFLMPRRLVFYSTNTYYEALQETIQKYEKEGMKHYD